MATSPALTLVHAPVADCARYDLLQGDRASWPYMITAMRPGPEGHGQRLRRSGHHGAASLKRTTLEVLADLLHAEAAYRHAASIRYRMMATKLPLIRRHLSTFIFKGAPINKGLVRSLYDGRFLDTRRNVVLVGGTGMGKTHLATAITANVVRAGGRGRYSNVVAERALDLNERASGPRYSLK